MTEDKIRDEDFDQTTAFINQGVRSVAIDRAVQEIEDWRKRLADSGDPGLRPIADNLAELRDLLSADKLDPGAIGRTMTELGDRTEAVAVSGTASQVADKLQILSQLLTDEGRSVTEEAERSTTEGERPGGRER